MSAIDFSNYKLPEILLAAYQGAKERIVQQRAMLEQSVQAYTNLYNQALNNALGYQQHQENLAMRQYEIDKQAELSRELAERQMKQQEMHHKEVMAQLAFQQNQAKLQHLNQALMHQAAYGDAQAKELVRRAFNNLQENMKTGTSNTQQAGDKLPGDYQYQPEDLIGLLLSPEFTRRLEAMRATSEDPKITSIESAQLAYAKRELLSELINNIVKNEYDRYSSLRSGGEELASFLTKEIMSKLGIGFNTARYLTMNSALPDTEKETVLREIKLVEDDLKPEKIRSEYISKLPIDSQMQALQPLVRRTPVSVVTIPPITAYPWKLPSTYWSSVLDITSGRYYSGGK